MKITITIKEKLYKDLKAYCNLNNIDIDEFCNNAISKELVEQKYGDIPFGVIGKDEKNDLPSIKIDESKIPSKLVSNEIIPVMPMSEPDGLSVIKEIDEIVSSEKNKDEKNKETGKNKKRRL